MRGTSEEIAALKLGDTLYNFDGNRRAYDKPGFGGSPVYEKHFEPVKIVGETKVSWIMGKYETKVNKKTLDSSCKFADRGYFTKAGMEDDIWLHEHRYKIIDQMRNVSGAHLREVARIIGYLPS